MSKLSTVIITKNEWQSIRDCLESIKFSDEIVVFDDYSTDGTLDVVREYTDKVYQHEWMGYGKQKQLAVSKAQGDWILSIDADERVTPELKEEILKIINTPESDFDGFYIPFKFFFLGHLMRFGGCSAEKHLRLFAKRKGTFDEKFIHEGISVYGKTAKLKNHILHYSYKDLEDYFSKFNVYTSLDAQKRFSAGRKASMWHILILPFWTFLSMFVFRLGFLDGFYGFIWAVLSSFYVFAKYVKLRRLHSR
ncbi:MAG: glycosyltransferase family 2 protein [bacterium]